MAAPPQAAGPEPQEAPLAGLVANVSGNVQKYAVKKKKILNAEELELYELTQAAGVVIDQEVFKVIVDLLKMNVAPLAVFQMLKSMCAGHRLTETLTSESASTTTQPSGLESREESFVSAKNSKIPAPLSFSSALRPPRLTATKIVVYSPADACSPLSQGPPGSFQFSCCLFSPFAGRNKPNPALQAERSSREGSSQRMSRQSSATRLQKSGSAGKNAGGSSTQT
ncbi:mitotic-spindle organizing protein 2 isoform X2 [Latimeria chalumnae]|uniref:mitotic-spindle organizing protein 2 isoform X2 n=1 Tax=Latimeria chalumnae TaxID=7897 RepID=UPI0003C11D12|nr:PREDICTED: mitotic-spindle organizing protein 2B-like isoform X2 [Latimeria chalumnae]|eukprot:XP_005990313.1 PREDICTED: mitotic-spindle organizing protein 2B-like isoform X2 [Latimeria chalumnae]